MEKNKQSIFVSPNKIDLVNPNIFSFIRNIDDIRKHKQNTTIQELLQFKTHNTIPGDRKLKINSDMKSYDKNDDKMKREHFNNSTSKQIPLSMSKSEKIDRSTKTKINNAATISTPLKSKEIYDDTTKINSSNNSISSTTNSNNKKLKYSTVKFSTVKHNRKTIIDLEKELLEKQSELRKLEIKALNNKLVVQSVVTHIDKNQENYEKEVQRLVTMINRAKSDLKLQYTTAQSI